MRAQPLTRGSVARHKAIVVEFVLFSTSTVAFQGTRLGVGLIAAATVAPSDFGTWGIALAVFAYGVHATGGIVSGLNRELPRHLGAGDHDQARSYERATYGVVLAVGSLIGATGALFALATGQLLVALLAGAVGLQQVYVYLQASLRSRFEFNRASVQQILMALVFPLICIPLLPGLGVSALLLGQLVAFAAACGLVLLRWRPVLRPAADVASVLTLARIGLPIAAAGVAFALLTTLDRWVVLLVLGEELLGTYSLASVVASGMLLLATVVGQQVYPRMARLHGQTQDIEALWGLALRQSVIVSLMLAPAAAALLLAAWIFVPAILPGYVGSLAPVTILAPGLVLLTAAGGFANLLIVLGRSKAYLAAIVAACVIEVVATSLLAGLGFGLQGIAVGAAAAYAVLLATLVGLAHHSRLNA